MLETMEAKNGFQRRIVSFLGVIAALSCIIALAPSASEARVAPANGASDYTEASIDFGQNEQDGLPLMAGAIEKNATCLNIDHTKVNYAEQYCYAFTSVSEWNKPKSMELGYGWYSGAYKGGRVTFSLLNGLKYRSAAITMKPKASASAVVNGESCSLVSGSWTTLSVYACGSPLSDLTIASSAPSGSDPKVRVSKIELHLVSE